MKKSLTPVKKFLSGIFLLLSGTLHAQEINYKGFNVQNGLTSNEVFDIIQDQEKNIWIATARGVVKYNGEVFTQYTTEDGLGGNVVYYLVPDGQKRIWFLASNGNLSYYFQSKIFTYQFNSVIKKRVEDRSFVRSLLVSKEDLYLGTIGAGFFKIDGNGHLFDLRDPLAKSGRTFAVNEIQSNYLLSTRNFVPASPDMIRLYLEKDTISVQLKKNGGMQNLFFVKRKNGDELISVYNYLFHIDHGNRLIEEYKYQNDIISIYEDRDSNVWIGSKVNGVRKFSGKKGFGENKSDENYFVQLSVSKTLQDADGNYWFATLENGIFYIPEINIKTIVNNSDVKAPFYISTILKTKQGLFIGTNGGGLYVFDQPQLTSKTDEYHTRPMGNIVGCYDLNGEIFISGDRSAKYITGNNRKKIYRGAVNCVIMDRTGNIFSCMSRNVCKISLGADTVLVKNVTGCRFESITETSDGRIWLGGNAGLFQIVKDEVIPAPIPLYNKLHVTDIKESNGKLFLATLGNGIIILSPGHVNSINKTNGLLSEMINKIIIEDDRYIWAATTKGLYKINIGSGSIETIVDSRKGLPSDEIRMLCLQNDTLYVANNSFVSFFNTKNLKPNNTDPEILLENIRLNDKTWEQGDGANFSHDQNNIEFTIHSYVYRQLGNIEYKYRLKGLEENYTYTTNNVVRFTFLPPGNYTFEAYALNEDRKQSSSPLIFSFSIQQAYWKTTWFYILVFSLSVSIIGIIIYSYFKRIGRKRNLQLELLESKQQAFTNQMNPHFIFNALNSVQTYILAENKTEALNYLGKFSKLMRQTLNNTREVLVSLSSEVDLITHYLELEQSRYNGIQYKIDVEMLDTESPMHIPSMLIQPFIENSIKHGILKKFDKEGLIQIRFFMKEKLLYCVIEDDGVGLNEALKIKGEHEEHSSAGIEITLDRLRLYCKTYKTPYYFEIIDKSETDSRESGTRVKFIIPYTLKHETNSDHH